MKFVNHIEYDGTLYYREYLYHWWKRRIEFSYRRTYLDVSSKHSPKHRFHLKLYKLSINLEIGNAPWAE